MERAPQIQTKTKNLMTGTFSRSNVNILHRFNMNYYKVGHFVSHRLLGRFRNEILYFNITKTSFSKTLLEIYIQVIKIQLNFLFHPSLVIIFLKKRWKEVGLPFNLEVFSFACWVNKLSPAKEKRKRLVQQSPPYL